MEEKRRLMMREALFTSRKEPYCEPDVDLFQRRMEIERRDDRTKGRIAAWSARRCPSHGRTMTRGRAICLVSGRASVANGFER